MSCKACAYLDGKLGALRLCATVFTVVSMLALNACAMAESEESGAAHDPAPTPVPADAIMVSPDLYMRPMGVDDGGCPVFQPWSPTLMVVQALHWQAVDGTFTLDSAQAACPPTAGDDQNDCR